MSPAEPDLRASDAERERTVAQLRDHFGAGRLSEEELDERSDAAYAARTVSELSTLLADLPALPATPARPGHDAGREAAKKRVLYNAGSAALISLVCVVVWVATGAGAGFWPIWVMLGVGARSLFVTWNELGPGADERRRLGQGSSSRPGADRSPRR
ncbi:DUF1707 domain-containing protein [Conexibacter stalactiti]|uniref:DUF1707 domain-containing protein n=1 Tax=Conexibacter stalactiti TaxID=1940611 RepID=A0ABU4HWR7_9ACTN|nr:DUF1707 domain-containing protein [Conexibacter stalactiti]MDW5596509.1 DUF1707 domain-containing protein [Conexibacter stalactiti]MEC5037151.1 DUF1707 domain-containing protein [Conexibacter stalactiti]